CLSCWFLCLVLFQHDRVIFSNVIFSNVIFSNAIFSKPSFSLPSVFLCEAPGSLIKELVFVFALVCTPYLSRASALKPLCHSVVSFRCSLGCSLHHSAIIIPTG
ncbi:unnamed protein product, partial [Choristocarpus tenellus]